MKFQGISSRKNWKNLRNLDDLLVISCLEKRFLKDIDSLKREVVRTQWRFSSHGRIPIRNKNHQQKKTTRSSCGPYKKNNHHDPRVRYRNPKSDMESKNGPLDSKLEKTHHSQLVFFSSDMANLCFGIRIRYPITIPFIKRSQNPNRLPSNYQFTTS